VRGSHDLADEIRAVLPRLSLPATSGFMRSEAERSLDELGEAAECIISPGAVTRGESIE
jgi:hypothetical protein